MTRAPLALMFVLISAASAVGAQNKTDDSAQSSGNLRGFSTTSAMRRAYPGGRDDTDLAVQPSRKITKKESDLDRTENEPEPEQEISGSEEGFGE